MVILKLKFQKWIIFIDLLYISFKQEYGITAVSLHPGYVRTDIFREFQNSPLKSFIYTLATPFLSVISKNCQQGAQTTIYCAVDEDVPKHNGKYFEYIKKYRFYHKKYILN